MRRERYARERDELPAPDADHERLQAEHRRQAGGQELREPVRGHHRRLETA